MRKKRRRTKEKNKKYTRKRKKSKEKNNQTNKTKPIQGKRWVAFWRRVISIYHRTISFLWLQPLFSRRSTERALAENTFAFQVKSVVHMDGNNRGSTADFICSHCIDCLYLFDLPPDPGPGDWSHYSGFCYHVSNIPCNQRQARSFCHSLHGDLVKVTSAEENEFVLYLARKFARNGKPAWIGLYYHAPSRAYYWTDNSVPTYTDWAPKEPNGYSKEPCAVMYTGSSHLPTCATGYWNDILDIGTIFCAQSNITPSVRSWPSCNDK